MSNAGTDFGQDFTLTPGARTLTTTSQYHWVCGGSGTSSFTPDIPNTIPMARVPVGIIQNMPHMSANSAAMVVRTSGVSRAVCIAPVTAFNFVQVDASTGSIAPTTQFAAGITTTTLQTLAAGYITIAGQVIEDGVTNQVVEMIIRVSPGPFGWV